MTTSQDDERQDDLPVEQSEEGRVNEQADDKPFVKRQHVERTVEEHSDDE